MSFTSATFLYIFLPTFIILYPATELLSKKFTILEKIRLTDLLLVLLSLCFYTWACFDNIFFLIIITIFIYFNGKIIEYAKCKSAPKTAKLICSFVVIFLISLLFIYKYSLQPQLNGFHWIPFVTPLGLSFITFSMISYIVDIYRGVPSGDFLSEMLYICYFPKVISGPIVGWKDWRDNTFDKRILTPLDLRLTNSIDRFIIGLSKKVIIADQIGMIITTIGVDEMDVPTTWLLSILYTLQIYFDFSGYSDIAISLCKLTGFDMCENFNFPYVSTSIGEFWRRWHMSLGSWFKDYLYIPLGGSRKGYYRTLFNLFFVMLISGLWHGSGLGYIIWGCLHGCCIVFERISSDKNWYIKTPTFIKWFFTFFIVMIGWQFFRVNTLDGSLVHFGKMLGINNGTPLFTFQYYLNRKTITLATIAFFGATLSKRLIDFIAFHQLYSSCIYQVGKKLALIMLLIISIICITNSTYSPFIYFQY